MHYQYVVLLRSLYERRYWRMYFDYQKWSRIIALPLGRPAPIATWTIVQDPRTGSKFSG